MANIGKQVRRVKRPVPQPIRVTPTPEQEPVRTGEDAPIAVPAWPTTAPVTVPNYPKGGYGAY